MPMRYFWSRCIAELRQFGTHKLWCSLCSQEWRSIIFFAKFLFALISSKIQLFYILPFPFVMFDWFKFIWGRYVLHDTSGSLRNWLHSTSDFFLSCIVFCTLIYYYCYAIFCCFLSIWRKMRRATSVFIVTRPNDTQAHCPHRNIQKIVNQIKQWLKNKLNNIPDHNIVIAQEHPADIKLI
jgi:hypothetical protein